MEKAPGHMPHANTWLLLFLCTNLVCNTELGWHWMLHVCDMPDKKRVKPQLCHQHVGITHLPSLSWKDHLLPSGILVHHCGVYLSSSHVLPNPQCFTMTLCSDEQVKISKILSLLYPNEEEIHSLCIQHC